MNLEGIQFEKLVGGQLIDLQRMIVVYFLLLFIIIHNHI